MQNAERLEAVETIPLVTRSGDGYVSASSPRYFLAT